MLSLKHLSTMLLGSAVSATLAAAAFAADFDIPGGDLKVALAAYTAQSGVELIVSSEAIRQARTGGAKGALSPDAALTHILAGTGFVVHRTSSGAVGIVRDRSSSNQPAADLSIQIAQAAPARAAVETVTVTSSKLGGADVQSIPIAITALSQEQLTSRQVAGGPDLVREVPNLTFSKTNFTGYNIQIRGIGTQAISVTTDPAVAVAFNDMPFIRNHFFEQEFYDVGQLEVLRGPQGTLYGRNATAGVVNIVSAKPTDQFEAMASADIGNHQNRRFEGMINLPILDDRFDIRLAGEWTKRKGYSFNEQTDSSIDGRDLWSGRMTIGFKPTENLQTYLVWEHFQEDDDRIRSSKQLCKRDNGLTEVNGVPAIGEPGVAGADGRLGEEFLSQGCAPVSLYSPQAFQTPNALALPYFGGLIGAGFGQSLFTPLTGNLVDAYAGIAQSTDLRTISSALDPKYRARNDTIELNTDYTVTPVLTFTSQTGFNNDFLWSAEDYNRFNTNPGIFNQNPGHDFSPIINDQGQFCDPQLGCSNRLVAEDLSMEHSWQLNQEFRLASHFAGPLNFSVGGNYMHYETEENYYVFINTLTMYVAKYFPAWTARPEGTTQCDVSYRNPDPFAGGDIEHCLGHIDLNPITNLDNEGHNYFLSQNPYVLNSYAGFGEVYYNVTDDLKFVGGLRWTDDQKHFVDIPSELLSPGYGYPIIGVVDQGWQEFTGRFTANWTPKLEFTDQTLVYGSFAHGYKAGGANPPGAVFQTFGGSTIPFAVHPLTFKPEFIDAYEAGTKNTLLDDALTVNGTVFYYNYKNYQISEIVDRTSINLNFDAHVKGAELETTWEPLPGLKFSFAGGYEDAKLAGDSRAVDLMDRTASNPDWVLVKPFVTQASNCILPAASVAYMLGHDSYQVAYACGVAYNLHLDPVTGAAYTSDMTGAVDSRGEPIAPGAYNGFDPTTAPNNGEGFAKDIGGNQLPNAPHFTTSFSAEYSVPVTSDWAATFHGDFYWQSDSFARIFNDRPYDQLRGYTNVNLSLILTDQDGWQAMAYVKNIFDTTAITGAFLNSDDTALTTNVFTTDPRLFGVRITRNW